MFAAAVVIYVVYATFRNKKNEQLAETGEDMARLRDAVAKVLSEETGYQVAYAHWEKVEYYGRSRRTTYYCYALAFDASRLWVIPLRFEKDKILPSKPILITNEALGIAKVQTSVKNNELAQVSVVIMDKEGASPVNLEVAVMNTRSDRFHHLNIAQKAECEQFERFISGMSSAVALENDGLEERLKEKELVESGKRSKILGILGLVFCWAGFIGLIFGGIGLFIAPKPSETGGKAALPFILCLTATIISAVTTIVPLIFILTY